MCARGDGTDPGTDAGSDPTGVGTAPRGTSAGARTPVRPPGAWVAWPRGNRADRPPDARAGPVPGTRLHGADACGSTSPWPRGLAVCVGAFVVEVIRALDGNSLSWAYVFEWPILATFAVYMWWNLLHGRDGRRRTPTTPPWARTGDHGAGGTGPRRGPVHGSGGPTVDQGGPRRPVPTSTPNSPPGRPTSARWRPRSCAAPHPTESSGPPHGRPAAGPGRRGRSAQTRLSASSKRADTPPSTPKMR